MSVSLAFPLADFLGLGAPSLNLPLALWPTILPVGVDGMERGSGTGRSSAPVSGLTIRSALECFGGSLKKAIVAEVD